VSHGLSELETLMGAETLARPASSDREPPDAEVPAPERIAGYLVRGLLGEGSMCHVYRAYDPKAHREVAVKVLKPALAKDPRSVERFLREAAAGARLRHPALVAILGAGPQYLVQELVEGETLAARLRRRGPICPRDALSILSAVAEGLDHTHARAVVHRDVKPSNVLLPWEGGAKLADFGIARLAWAPITCSGEVLGSPAYMAPEQVKFCVADARSDLFSLAVVIHETLTGSRPFRRPSLGTLLESIVMDDPPRASAVNPALPAAVDEVLGRALAKDPDRRYPSGRALATALGVALLPALAPCP
jgi:serine/threonine-protein kinase